MLLVFCGRAGSADFVCFYLFRLCPLCLLLDNGQYLGGVRLVTFSPPLFALFFAGLLICFFLSVFLRFATRGEYCRPGPCGHPHAFSACPPTVYAPTTPIPTIHGHPRASALVCVSVSSVYWCFWPCEHVARSCACVFVSVDGVQMCVLGVLRISRGPEPNLEPSH